MPIHSGQTEESFGVKRIFGTADHFHHEVSGKKPNTPLYRQNSDKRRICCRHAVRRRYQLYQYAELFLQFRLQPDHADRDFPLTSRLSKWGANDDITFRHLYEDIKNRDNQAPWLSTFLTLSSHEPFEVPYHRLDEMGLYPNSVAFTDSCIGNFIDKLKELPVWKNTLVIFVSDHGYPYPKDVVNYEPRRYHIPMLWIGGAVKEPVVIDKLANQTDLAATLLNQLGIDHDTFTFSRNILSPDYPEYAFYTYSNGFGFIDSTGISVYDNEGNKPLIEAPRKGSDLRLRKGKALLQTLYDDLGNR